MAPTAKKLEEMRRHLIVDQLDRNPDARQLRVWITVSREGVASTRSRVLFDDRECPSTAPTFEGDGYRAWGQFSETTDDASFLIKRLAD